MSTRSPDVTDTGPAAGISAGSVDVIAISGEELRAQEARLTAGRVFDDGMSIRGDPVVIVGESVAARLGLRANGAQTLWVDGTALQVIGVVSSPDLASVLPLSLIVPLETAERVGWSSRLQPPRFTVRTRLGAAPVVGQQVALALDPTRTGNLVAAVPPSPTTLEDAVESQTRSQLIALAGVSIAVGAVGVSNTTLVGVLERRHEIGVRRAVGASRGAILVQFLLESAALGFIGGLVGSVAGVATALVTASVNDWIPVLPLSLVTLGPLLGCLVGLVAGIYPAGRAARIEPAAALA